MPTPVITRPEYFTANGIPSATPAWEHIDLLAFRTEGDQRGGDILVPGAAGVLPQLRRRTVTLRAVTMRIFGEFDQFGGAYSDPLAGIEANIDALMAGWVAPTGTGDGTRAITWHRRDATTKTSAAHFLGMPLSDDASPVFVTGVLKLSFPSPVWT